MTQPRFLLWGLFLLGMGAIFTPTTAEEEPSPPPLPVIVDETAVAAPTETVVLGASADAFVASSQPSTNYGNVPDMRVGNDPFYGSMLTLMQFRFDQDLPQDDRLRIDAARLELFVDEATPAFDGPLVVDVFRMDSLWNEQNVNWGVELVTDDGRVDSVGVGRTAGPYSWDVTDTVQEWIDGGQTNYGFLLQAELSPTQQRNRVFYTSESSVSALRPRLTVEYTADGDPPNVSVAALPEFSLQTFTVSWSGSDEGPAGLDYYDVQFRVDGGAWQNWQTETEATSAAFTGSFGSTYDFRARGVDTFGNVEAYGGAQATTTIRSEVEATVQPLSAVQQSPFTVRWEGDDGGGPAITGYTIYYRHNREGGWQVWLSNTADTSRVFNPLNGDGVYEFEAVARNSAGEVESQTGRAEAVTMADFEAPFLKPRLRMPIVYNN